MTVFYVVRGDQRVARAIAHQTLALARNSGDTGYVLEAHNVMASALFYSGRLLEVLEHCDSALGLYDPREHGGHAFVYGQDPKVCALSWRASPDRAWIPLTRPWRPPNTPSNTRGR